MAEGDVPALPARDIERVSAAGPAPDEEEDARQQLAVLLVTLLPVGRLSGNGHAAMLVCRDNVLVLWPW